MSILDSLAIAELEFPPPEDLSLAKAFWCDLDYFLDHTATGGHLPCSCPANMGHNDPSWCLVNKDSRF